MNTTITPSWLRAIMLLFTLVCLTTVTSSANPANFLTIHCPENQEISCLDETSDLSVYGTAYIEGYNGIQYLKDPTVSYHLNICGIGHIDRTWKTYDYHANLHSCTQTIQVNSLEEEPDIDWPDPEIKLTGCDPAIHPDSLEKMVVGSGYPVVLNEECRFWGKTYKDKEFNFGTDCKKIIRSWQLVDWCTYRPNTRGQGIWKFTQVIKISNTEMPLTTLPNDTIVSSYNCVDAQVTLEPISVMGVGCNQHVIITNNSPYATYSGADASGIYPIGTTKVVFKVQYGCGLNDQYEVFITVEDHAAPVPLCTQKLAIALMPVYTEGVEQPTDGMVEVWAKDFDLYSSHPCQDQTLSFSFSQDITDNSRIFRCSDSEAGENPLKIWVTDELGNYSICDVVVDIQNNNANIPDCPENLQDSEENLTTEEENLADNTEGPMVFGQVYTYYDLKPVENVSLNLVDESPDTLYTTLFDTIYQQTVVDSFTNSRGTKFYILESDTIYETREVSEALVNEKSDFSDENGMFYFHNVSPDRRYLLRANKEEATKTGINNDDLLSLYSHVMGLEIITDPYILLAADVNGSGKVDFVDVTVMLDYLSGDIQRFPAESAWILISEDLFLNSGEKMPEDDASIGICHLEEFTASSQKANFIAIKRGDLVNTENETRTNIGDVVHALKNNSRELNNSPVFFPNPFTNQLSLKLHSTINETIRLQVTDLQGRVIMDDSFEINIGNNEFSLDQLIIEQAGIYLYRIWKNNSIDSGKLIKSSP